MGYTRDANFYALVLGILQGRFAAVAALLVSDLVILRER